MPRARSSVLTAITLGVSGLLCTVVLAGLSGLGSSAPVQTSFATPYTVTFNESGLPAGTNWSVRVVFQGCGCDGVTRTVHSNGTQISIPITNGTYKYRVPVVPGFWLNSTYVGTFNVSGANVTGPGFVFHPLPTYPVQFVETGLPASHNWSASWHGNGTGQYGIVQRGSAGSPGAFLNASLPNGSYHFTVAPVNGSFFVNGSARGSFVVAGAPLNVSVKFTTPPLFTVTFTEHGLPNGTNWSVRVSGWGGVPVHETRSGTGPSIVFYLPNGTYHYALSEVLGFAVNGSTVGSFLLGQSPLGFNVSYRQLSPGEFYPVAFDEAGLANGTHWSVTVVATHTFGFSRKETQSATGPHIFFLLQNGSYRYVAHPPRGYALVSGGSGVFGIFGSAPSTFVVTFKVVPTYAVTYTETGLANGTNWSGLLRTQTAGSTPWPIHIVQTVNSTTMTFYVPNGTYCFVIHAVPGYTVTSGVRVGSLTVSGGPPAPVAIGFTPLA